MKIILTCFLLTAFLLSGCEPSQSGWLGTGIEKEKIHIAPLPQSVVTVPTGASGAVKFSVSIALGASREDIALSVLGLPNNVTHTFDPASCKATLSECIVTMTLSVGTTVPIGETPISIVGTGALSQKSTTLKVVLIVLPTLTISPKPTGGIITTTIASTDGTKINCGTNGSICSGIYPIGTIVTLTANPGSNFLFDSWSGGCSGGIPTCSLTMNAAKTVSAVFVLKTFSLTVNTVGSGSVASDIAGIDCEDDCTEEYPSGTIVTLTANPVTGGVFAGWSGDCSGTADMCELSMDDDITVTAEFDLVFEAAMSFPAPANTDPNSIAIDFLNGDGELDIVIANFNAGGNVAILIGVGGGEFGTATTSPVGAGPNYVVIDDFNRDGDNDIAVANESGDTISILLGNGEGLFSTTTPIAVGDAPRSIAVSDLNQDGNLDIVTANLNSNNVSILNNVPLLLEDGIGSSTTYPVGRNPHSVALRDMNKDTHVDIVTADFSDDTVSVLLNNGDGTFNNASDSPFPIGEGAGIAAPFSVSVFDVNNDGIIDIVTANRISNTVSLLLGVGLGDFSLPKDIPVGTSPRFVTMDDLNGDGNTDIVTANFGSNNVSVLLGDGTGNFPTSLNFPVGRGPRSVAIRDLDGDGKLDLITANATDRNISVLLNQ
jgi:hypothetical protein